MPPRVLGYRWRRPDGAEVLIDPSEIDMVTEDRASELPPIQELRRVALKPGDVVVVRLGSNVPPTIDVTNRIKAIVEDIFEGHKVMVLPFDIDLEVVEPQ